MGPGAAAVTFFVGSILFTAGGALQTLAVARRAAAPTWAAAVQSAGTLFFNVTTFAAMHTALTNPEYDRLVWRPDAFGSICFLVSGAIAYAASSRHGWLPARGARGLVAAGREPAGLRLLRDLGGRRLRGARRAARCSISPPRTGTRRSAPRASSPARWPGCARRHTPDRMTRPSRVAHVGSRDHGPHAQAGRPPAAGRRSPRALRAPADAAVEAPARRRSGHVADRRGRDRDHRRQHPRADGDHRRQLHGPGDDGGVRALAPARRLPDDRGGRARLPARRDARRRRHRARWRPTCCPRRAGRSSPSA